MGKAVAVAANLIVLGVYIVGAGWWVSSGSGWYRSLQQPGWQPPDALFGLAWSYNFAMLGIVGTLIALSVSRAQQWTWLGFFGASVAAALTWAFLFYSQQNLPIPPFALGSAFLLTIPMVLVAFRFNVWAGVAMLPYLTWLGVATSLSIGYAVLNRG